MIVLWYRQTKHPLQSEMRKRVCLAFSPCNVAITLFHAVGLPFLEKLIRSPVDGDYASSYCAVGLAFVKKCSSYPCVTPSFCDYPSLQKDIVQLIVPMLQQLKDAQNDVLRRDILTILFSLSTNTQLLPVFAIDSSNG